MFPDLIPLDNMILTLSSVNGVSYLVGCALGYSKGDIHSPDYMVSQTEFHYPDCMVS